MVLNDERRELSHDKSRFLDTNDLMTRYNTKLKNQKVRAAVRYHHTNPQKNIEHYAHHFLFTFFFSFYDEAYFKSLPFK